MKILKNYKKIIENNLIFVSTSSKKSKPHLIVCADARVFKNYILITDNYMKVTKKNIFENNSISLCVGSLKQGFLYIKGRVEYKQSGKYFTSIKSLK